MAYVVASRHAHHHHVAKSLASERELDRIRHLFAEALQRFAEEPTPASFDRYRAVSRALDTAMAIERARARSRERAA